MTVLAGPFGDAVARLDRRFLTTSVIPTIVLLTGVSVVGVLAFNAGDSLAAAWTGLDVGRQLIAGIVASAVVWFISAMISSNWRKIVRLYEGYPIAWLYRRFGRRHGLDMWWVIQCTPGAAYHFHRRRAVEARVAYKRYAATPFETEMLPTTIGNILLSAERYAIHRYGLDVTLLWPRLYWQIPEASRADLDSFKEEHQLPLSLSFMAACFSVVSAVLVLCAGGPWELFAISTSTGVVLSLIAYVLSAERAEEYAEQLRATVDLNHAALRAVWAEPEDDEKQFFARVEHFVVHGTFLDSVSTPAVRTALDAPTAAQGKVIRPGKLAGKLLRSLRLTHVVLLIAALLILIGSIIVAANEVSVPVPVNSTGAYARVSEITMIRVPRSAVSSETITDPAVLRGSLTLSPLLRDHAVNRNDVVRLLQPNRAILNQVPILDERIPRVVEAGQLVDMSLASCKVDLKSVPILRVNFPQDNSPLATAAVLLTTDESRAVSRCSTARAVITW